MRQYVIAGNWKMNKTPAEAAALIADIKPLVADASCGVIVGVPFVEMCIRDSPCSMCKRLIINAGISRVVIRNTRDSFTAVYVQEWIEHDASLAGEFGY